MASRVFQPGPSRRTVRTTAGKVVPVPKDWSLLPPGDAAFTRRVKAAGDYWAIQDRKGRRTFSRGIWALTSTIDRIRAELEAERSTESFAKRKAAAARRREKQQGEYIEEFTKAVLTYLAFHPEHADLAQRLTEAVTKHATPVGSGTVARTKLLPIEKRAEMAVLAWMRHQTTGYDSQAIPRTKGARREVRRKLARQSKKLLDNYRHEKQIPQECPLSQALAK